MSLKNNKKKSFNTNFILDSYIIRPVKVDEIDNFIKELCQHYHPKYFQIQKKFIRWSYQSPFKKGFVKDSETTLMVAIQKNTSKIGAIIGFIGSVSFVKNKEFYTAWDILYNNFTNIPGLALEVLKYLNSTTKIYCGNGFNKRSLRSYQRIFDKKNFIPEVNRKIAIIDSFNCNEVFNWEKNIEKSDFINKNEAKLTKCKPNQIFDISLISEKYWEDHIGRFLNTCDRRKKYLEWRFVKHPYMKYNILSIESKAEKGLAIVRIEKIKNLNIKVLRIMDLLPARGFEQDLQNMVLNFAKDNNCILVDFFCSFEKKINEICSQPFVDFADHKNFNIPYRFQPPEVIEKKSFNLFINFNFDHNLLANEFYTTKTDGEMDLYFDQSGQAVLLENYY